MDQYQEPLPTFYDDAVVIAEYCNAELQHCGFHNIVELVGTFQLHQITQLNGVASRKAVTAAIEAFNRQNQTRLTYESVAELAPTYSFAPLDDPIIYCSDMTELKKRACQMLMEYRQPDWSKPDFNAVNTLLLNMEKTGIDTVIAYYPSGFYAIYKSPYVEVKPTVEVEDGQQMYAMSELLPVPGIDLDGHAAQSYSLPPDEQGSLKMERAIALERFYERKINHIRPIGGH